MLAGACDVVAAYGAASTSGFEFLDRSGVPFSVPAEATTLARFDVAGQGKIYVIEDAHGGRLFSVGGAVIASWMSGTTIVFQGPNGRDLQCAASPPPSSPRSRSSFRRDSRGEAPASTSSESASPGRPFDGKPVPTAFVDSTSLRAILTDDTLAVGAHALTVQNANGGIISAPTDFGVLAPSMETTSHAKADN